MLYPIAGSQPLHITRAITSRVSQRVKMIDITALDNGNGFKASMRMLRKTGNTLAIIHVIFMLLWRGNWA